jgi:hypothetical protein
MKRAYVKPSVKGLGLLRCVTHSILSYTIG